VPRLPSTLSTCWLQTLDRFGPQGGSAGPSWSCLTMA